MERDYQLDYSIRKETIMKFFLKIFLLIIIPSGLILFTTRADNIIEKPSANNTGHISDYETLANNTISGNFYLATEGMVFEKYLMTDGNLIVTANNITIRDGLHTDGSYFNILIPDGVTGTVIEHVELIGARAEAIRGGDYTASYLHIHDQEGDAIKPKNNVSIAKSFFERLGSAEGAHADGVQIMEGYTNIDIRFNTFDMPPGIDGYENSICIIIHPTANDIIIDSNWINGGGYSVNVSRDAVNVELINNIFGFDFAFGPFVENQNFYMSCNIWGGDGIYKRASYSAGDLLPGQTNSENCDKSLYAPSSPSELKIKILPH
jgi:hypothetical protein